MILRTHLCNICKLPCSCLYEGYKGLCNHCPTVLPKTATERRAELVAMGRELISVMREIIGPINKIACRLDAEASLLMAESADETIQAPRKRSKIVYREAVENEIDKLKGWEPGKKMEAVFREAALMPQEDMLMGTGKRKGKRACSKCRKTGHRAQNCQSI